ncbi:clarin-2-like isoform X2 [Dreissena polymorpha]|uniref:clarin-2-like isoform X2 n=1 Tax=Dreissena polymorpha TaxID=45954 RepID=UPI002265573E|nr:clarin-2-like isoform X2 [Dreissena polymorpha]
MEKNKKLLISTTIVLSFFAVLLILISLATDSWVESNPKLLNTVNNTRGESEANYGLFKGFRIKDVGFGPRSSNLQVVCSASDGVCVLWPEEGRAVEENTADEYITKTLKNMTANEPLWQSGLFNFGYYVTIIICAALSMVFGIISIGFAVFNICGKPIETITGPCGLYVWNGFAFLFSILEMAMFLALFFTNLKENCFLKGEWEKFSFREYTNLGFSFYLIPGAAALYFLNVVCMFCSGYKLKCSFSDEAEKVVDNGMILY